MNKFFGHLKTVYTHKFWVFHYAVRLGIPVRGLLHDMSKFHPIEFFEGVKYYTGTHSPIEECKKINGYSRAWMHHKGHNKHHYEYWQDNFDKGGHPVLMPYKDTLEELCDFIGASRAYNGKDFSFQKLHEYWLNRRKNPMAMHPVQLAFFDDIFCAMAEAKELPAEWRIRQLYNICVLVEEIK